MENIKIERLYIRLKNVSVLKARDITTGLGNEILNHLTNNMVLRAKRMPTHINEITLAPIKAEKSTSSTVQKVVANDIAVAISQNPE